MLAIRQGAPPRRSERPYGLYENPYTVRIGKQNDLFSDG